MCLISTQVHAQEDELEDLLDLDLESLSGDDSLLVFLLIDDILSDSTTTKSSLAIRTGFGSGSSSISSSNLVRRNTYASLVYNHKSGLSIDATANFSNRYSPGFYGGGASISYLKPLGTKGSYNISYEYNWFNNVIEDGNEDQTVDFGELEHTFIAYTDYRIKSLTIGLDYNHFIGTSTHRVTPTVSSFISLSNVPILKKLVFAPTFFAMLGNDVRTTAVHYTEVDNFLIAIVRGANEFNDAFSSDKKFRALNAIFSFPILYTQGKFSLMLSYSLNVPFRKSDPFDVTYESERLSRYMLNVYGDYPVSEYQLSHYGSFSISYVLFRK